MAGADGRAQDPRAAPGRAEMQRLFVVLLFVLGLGLAAAPPASARCRHIEVPEETRSSAYVFEGTLESVAGRDLTFLVTAVWSGTPPQHVTVGTSGRRPLASASDVGTTYLVFAMGTAPDLSVARCGSSAPLASAGYAIAALEGLGLGRVAR
jgi:hypothetical protein